MSYKRTGVDELHSTLKAKRTKEVSKNPLDKYGVLMYTMLTDLAKIYPIQKEESLLLTLEPENGGISVTILKNGKHEEKFHSFSLIEKLATYLKNENPYEELEYNDNAEIKNNYTDEFILCMKPTADYFEEQHPDWNVVVEPDSLSSITEDPPTLYVCDNYCSWQFNY